MLPELHPGHGKITQIRVYYVRLNRPFKTRFRYGSTLEALSLAAHNNSPDHYAKGTLSPIPLARHRAPTACRQIGFRFYFTPLTGVLFNFPSRY